MEAAYVKGWRESVLSDDAGREKAYIAINIIGKVKDHLRQVMETGALAGQELEYLVKARKNK